MSCQTDDGTAFTSSPKWEGRRTKGEGDRGGEGKRKREKGRERGGTKRGLCTRESAMLNMQESLFALQKDIYTCETA